jgi:integral membrane protein
MQLSTTIGRLRLTGILEGLSFVILLAIAMPLKYMAGKPELVSIIGMAHGILFVLYVFLTAVAKFQFAWTWKKMFLLWIASVVPLGTFYADYRMLRFEDTDLKTEA